MRCLFRKTPGWPHLMDVGLQAIGLARVVRPRPNVGRWSPADRFPRPRRPMPMARLRGNRMSFKSRATAEDNSFALIAFAARLRAASNFSAVSYPSPLRESTPESRHDRRSIIFFCQAACEFRELRASRAATSNCCLRDHLEPPSCPTLCLS